MKLTKEDKKYLKSIDYENKDMKQIEDACNETIFAIFRQGIDSDECKIITNEEARELLGDEVFLSGISRSAFHFTASRIIPRTFQEFTILMDSGEMLGGKPSRLPEYKQMKETVEDIKAIQNFPHIYATDIMWDIDYDDDKEYLSTVVEIPTNIWMELDDDDYAEAISDYISDATGFCHEGFCIECNLSVDELYKLKDKYEKDLEEEYKDGETDWASNLECTIEEIEKTIVIMEAEKERDLDETPLEH